jgi:hypothetical protein
MKNVMLAKKIDRELRARGCYREDRSNGRFNVVRVCPEDQREDKVLFRSLSLGEISLLIHEGSI